MKYQIRERVELYITVRRLAIVLIVTISSDLTFK